MVPEVVGKVSVVVPATAGAASVTAPLVSPEITMLAISYPYKTTCREPDGIVNVTPPPIVNGPVDIPLYPAGIE
jgi:hypothetical protein